MNQNKKIELISEVEPFSLNINQAIPCSLLVNELVVNGFKHAFNDQSNGQIKVRIERKGVNIIMTISDNGLGFDAAKFSDTDTLGATLIKTLTMQLKGEFEILENTNTPGSIFRVEFPKQS